MSRGAAASLLLSLLASVAEADLLPRLLWLPNWDSPSVCLRTSATVSECAGRYDLVQDRKANGASLWLKPVDPFFGEPGGWIFRTDTGEWMVSWIEAEQDDFQKSEGCLASKERDAASPMETQDWITRHGATWRSHPTLCELTRWRTRVAAPSHSQLQDTRAKHIAWRDATPRSPGMVRHGALRNLN